MTSCKPISIPLEQNVKLSADEGDLVEDTTMYICIVGSLIYMTITRPDLSYAIGVVNQFMQTPQKPHLDVVKRILKYIKYTLQCIVLLILFEIFLDTNLFIAFPNILFISFFIHGIKLKLSNEAFHTILKGLTPFTMQFLITQVFNCTTHIFKIINVFSSEVFWQIIILT